MATVGDIIDAAARKITVQNMNATENADAIEALNDMLGQWSASPKAVNAPTRETFTITSGTASYTVGSGATIDTTWPSKIISCFVREDDDDKPLAVFSAKEYAFIGDKTISAKPAALYHERSYPSGTFFFWPTPDSSYTVHLWSNKAFTTYSSTATTVNLPPEYIVAIKYNLAIELAPEFGKEPSQLVIARAASTFKTLANMNSHPVPQVRTDVVCGTGCSSAELFSGYDNFSDVVGRAVLPFVLRS